MMWTVAYNFPDGNKDGRKKGTMPFLGFDPNKKDQEIAIISEGYVTLSTKELENYEDTYKNIVVNLFFPGDTHVRNNAFFLGIRIPVSQESVLESLVPNYITTLCTSGLLEKLLGEANQSASPVQIKLSKTDHMAEGDIYGIIGGSAGGAEI